MSVECAVSAFHSEIKLGPDFVCTCCHRMMYRKSVIPCNKAKYTKASADVINPRRACAARVTVVALCVCVCVCVFVCPGRSSATHATKRQTRYTHGFSILLAPE